MRLDRIITLLVWTPQRWLGVPGNRPRLPILMYHSVSEDQERGGAYYQTVTHPAVFASQMELLTNDGYVGVTLSQGIEWLRLCDSGAATKPVVLTFDDGFQDCMTAAVPVLRRNGFRATMYLPTGSIGDRRGQFKGRQCLTWDEVVDLHAEGFEFGSHTVTHPRLVDLTWAQIRSELVDSRAEIEQHLQSPVTAFAYPYAFPQERSDFVEAFTGILTEVGYRTCVTTKIGRMERGQDLLSLRRLPVNSLDDPGLLRAKLDGAYDWIAPAQSFVKHVKSLAKRA